MSPQKVNTIKYIPLYCHHLHHNTCMFIMLHLEKQGTPE